MNKIKGYRVDSPALTIIKNHSYIVMLEMNLVTQALGGYRAQSLFFLYASMWNLQDVLT